MTTTSVRLSDDLTARVEALAAKLQRSKSWVINEAVKNFLERADLEAKRWQETLEALESARAGDVIDGEAVERWLETWGTEHETPPPG